MATERQILERDELFVRAGVAHCALPFAVEPVVVDDNALCAGRIEERRAFVRIGDLALNR
jgi:hypothetical protein